MRKYLFLLFILAITKTTAQKIAGTVFNDKGDLLPYSSVTIKGTSIGASANNKAKYAINVTKGTYTIVCQHIGFSAVEKQITIDAADAELNFILAEQKLQMKEVIVKNGGEDPAYAIIRKAIKMRSFYADQVDAFKCDLYSKDIIKLRHLPKKFFGQKIPDEDRQDMGLDSVTGQGIIYLSEAIAKIASQKPNNFKMEVKSSRVSGSGSFGFAFPTFISFYQNNITIFSNMLNPRGFVSPIADGAIRYYKFKYMGSFWEDGKEVNTIRVTPRRTYEPLFTGIINITENDWRIHSLDVTLTKTSQLEILDTLQITQFHVPVTKDIWRVKNQLMHFNLNFFKIDAVGNFVRVYSDYDLKPEFGKKYFDKVVIKYDTNVSKKSKAYWDTIRPMPLEKEEIKDYQKKDSIFAYQRDSVWSKSNIDSLKKRQGKVRPLGILWGGIDRIHYSRKNRYNWGIEPLVDPFFKHLEYNSAEGIAVSLSTYYDKYLRNLKANMSISPTVRYSFGNHHLTAWADIHFQSHNPDPNRKMKNQSLTLSGGKRVSQFNKESPITPFVNTISTLFWGDNFMKIYENSFGSINFFKKFENGIQFNINSLFEDRRLLGNVTKHTLFKNQDKNLTYNYPLEKFFEHPRNYASLVGDHQAFIVSVDFSIKPGQKYIQLPYQKLSLGSKYPTFSVNYTKGIKTILGSDVDFDKWKFTIEDDKNFKLAGMLKYKFGMGGFLNNKLVPLQDYQHFNGNRSIAASDYVNSFQLAKYYEYSNTEPFFAFAHLEHHLNGLITNKIPLFKRLNWNLVAGTNTFYVNKNSNHVEIFVGIENLFKVFRVDFVAAFEDGHKGVTGIKIGGGGLLGGRFNRKSTPPSNRGRNMTISF